MTTAVPNRPGTRRTLIVSLATGMAGAAAGAALAFGEPLLLAGGAAAVVGAVLIVLDERWALGALAAFVILHLPEVATDYHGAPSLFQPLMAVVLLGIAARWAATGDRPPDIARVGLLVGAYFLVAVSSLMFATAPVDGVAESLGLLKDAGLAVIVGLLLGRSATLRTVTWVIVACGGFLAAISVFQFATDSYGSVFGGFGISSVEQIVGTYDDVRIAGPVGDANFYGQLLVAVLPLALDRMWGERTRRLRIAGGVCAALIAGATVLTFSRGAAVALIAVLVMMAVVYRPSLRSIAAVAVVGVLAIPFLPPGYLDRLTALTDVGSIEGSTDPSIRGRTAEITAAWRMFGDRPLTGVGFTLYDERYQDYVAGLGIELRSEDRDAHSLYLEVAAETGTAGVLTMGAVILGAFAALHRGRRRFEETNRLEQARIARALMASLVGFLITALFLHLDFARLFWLLVGLSYALPVLAVREDGEVHEPMAEVAS